jgi:glycosyltransferase involved in cell wall biosynthesis
MFTPLFHPHIGGVETHVKRLTEELIKKEYIIMIVTSRYNQSLLNFEKLNNVNVHRFYRTSLPKIWLWIFKHRQLIKKSDIIHCHDFHTFIFWYLPFRLLYPFKPVFITFHGHEGVFPIPRTIKLKRKIAEFLTKGNICVGDFIPKWYDTNADFIIYGGVGFPNSEEGVGDQKNSGVFVGRLESDTGIMTYINALKILKINYGINLEVDVCGDGSLRENIEATIKENKLSVKLLGFVDNLLGYMRKNRFAFVSGYLTILEAMINKNLVFAVYENELKKDYLTLMPNSERTMVIVGSPEELAEKIAHYSKNPEKANEKINNAYKFAKEKTWEKVADTYIQLWRTKK